jgi:hypothetical protein
MPGKPRTGSRFTFDAPGPLGAMHADNQSDDMAELDLHPGTEVKVVGHDDERDLVLLEWTDRQGNARITSVEPSRFADHFTSAKG